jgi:hypothetical protein
LEIGEEVVISALPHNTYDNWMLTPNAYRPAAVEEMVLLARGAAREKIAGKVGTQTNIKYTMIGQGPSRIHCSQQET